MNGYSLDLRERVLALVDAGTRRAEIVKTLRVSLASIGRYIRLRREGQSLAAKPRPGRRAHIGPAQAEALELQLLAVGTEGSLELHCELWEETQGVRVSGPTMSRALAKVAGWTRKKRRCAPASKTPLPGQLGGRWRAKNSTARS